MSACMYAVYAIRARVTSNGHCADIHIFVALPSEWRGRGFYSFHLLTVLVQQRKLDDRFSTPPPPPPLLPPYTRAKRREALTPPNPKEFDSAACILPSSTLSALPFTMQTPVVHTHMHTCTHTHSQTYQSNRNKSVTALAQSLVYRDLPRRD